MSELLLQVEMWPIATHIAETWWFPLLESLHVVGLVLLLGGILMVDLRLMRVAALRYPAAVLVHELTPWAWAGFGIAAITGLGLFITRASAYIENTAFLVKLALLVLAGLNVAIVHRRARRDDWSDDGNAAAGRWAGALSLGLWIATVVAGRWIGHLS